MTSDPLLHLEKLETDEAPKDVDALIFTELEVAAGKEPPTEFRIFKAGENRTKKGVFLFEEDDARELMKKADEHGADYCLDYGHSMFSFFTAGDPAETNKAAGWFTVELRQGELWATGVSWTELAATKLKAREYRYISPTFNRDEAGHIKELCNVALTNIPATNGLKPLVAHADFPAAKPTPLEKPKMEPKLLALLGLGSSATTAEVLAAVEALKAKSSAEPTLLALTSKETVSEAVGTVTAWRLGSETAEKLAQDIAAMQAQATKAEIKQVLADAVKAGKVAPAQVPMLTAMGEGSVEQLKAFIAAAPAVLPKGGVKESVDEANATQLTADDRKFARLMGHDPEKLAKLRMADRGLISVGTMTPEVDA